MRQLIGAPEDEPTPSSKVIIGEPEIVPAVLPVVSDEWMPSHNPTQGKVFADLTSLYILVYGEKASGKSKIGLDCLIRHCYLEKDALAFILAPQQRTGKEGALYDLSYALDLWRNGNKDKDGNRIDNGMGIEYTEPSLDPNTKDSVLYIKNIHGGKSKVMLISIPYDAVVEQRMKDLTPSFIYVSEITELESKKYFTYVSQQVGRRRGIKGPQQYVASCNPEGPSHWVYEVWWVDGVNQETGERKPEYAVYHIPRSENLHNLPDGYFDKLDELYKDPIDRQRLLDGIWIDRPSGQSIFNGFFRPEFHIRPPVGTDDHKRGLRFVLTKGFPIILGWDPGPRNFSVHFIQMVPSKEGKVLWIVFDELNFVGQFKPDYLVVPEIMRRMDHWNKHLGGSAVFVHICPDEAFNVMRGDGSYDALRIHQLSNKRIRLKPCPKPKDSVTGRVQLVRNMLSGDTLFISSVGCPKTVDMLRLLASENEDGPGKFDVNRSLKPKRSQYLHSFDSLSYPLFYFVVNPSAFNVRVESATIGAFRAGRG